MIIYHLSTENLRSNAFIKDFCFHFKPKGKAILLHDAFGSPNDTRFVSKRLSAYLSEELVVNTVLNGDQRSLLQVAGQAVVIRRELIDIAFGQVNLVILNCLSDAPSSPVHVDPVAVVAALRQVYDVEDVTVFPANPRSPLGQKPVSVAGEADIASLIAVYDEEAPALNMALRLAPSTLLNPAALAPKP